ncbi:uncharacterized protein [Aristolochia californica]|uniref:uncharacterized protein n=1 Tax=Aristolochia californica TaxID=171875 RepID=UPI0035E202CF
MLSNLPFPLHPSFHFAGFNSWCPLNSIEPRRTRTYGAREGGAAQGDLGEPKPDGRPLRYVGGTAYRMSEARPGSLYKQRSWSTDTYRDEAWLRRKEFRRRRRSHSVTDDDVDELKACIELGFGFDSPEVDRRLSDTLPALDFYYAVNKQYNDSVLVRTPSEASAVSETDVDAVSSPPSIFDPGDNPQLMKARLKQWAQVVACSIRQSPC